MQQKQQAVRGPRFYSATRRVESVAADAEQVHRRPGDPDFFRPEPVHRPARGEKLGRAAQADSEDNQRAQ